MGKFDRRNSQKMCRRKRQERKKRSARRRTEQVRAKRAGGETESAQQAEQ